MREGIIPPSERWFMSPLTDGSRSQVFVLNIEDRQSAYIVKVRADDPDGWIQQEGWAMVRARDTGAPVSEVVYVGSYRHDGKSAGVLVQTTVAGSSLADSMVSLSLGARIHAFRQMGEALGRIHQAQMGGFATRHPTGGWDYGTWEALMTSRLRDLRLESPLLYDAGLTVEEAQRLATALERYAAEFPCHSPVLCHGDYQPEHVFVDADGNVTGIIDFGTYFGGDPVSDLAGTRMALEAWALDQVLEGYQAAGGLLGDRFELHLHLSLVTALTGRIFGAMGAPGRPDLERHVQALRTTLDWLDRNAGS